MGNGVVKGAFLSGEAIACDAENGAIGTASFDVNGDTPAIGWSPSMPLNIPNVLSVLAA